MSLKINLSGHSDKFASESQELAVVQNVNFIFGRNGTGKTTIASEIKNQLSGDFEVYVFNDFDGVAENARLDAISLGTENAAIQKKLNVIDKEIIEIMKQTEPPKDSGLSNLYTKANKAKLKLAVTEKEIDSLYAESAKRIKGQANPQISIPSYNKKHFINEMPNAILLSETDILAYKSTIKSDEKSDVESLSLPNIALQKYLDTTNEVLSASVPQPQEIPELHNNAQKQSFAKQGIEIHEETPGEICAFCGNEITNERWKMLGDYFNAEVKKLEGRINNGIQKITEAIDSVKNSLEPNETLFYEKYLQDIHKLNLQIKAKKEEYKDFFEQLKNSLESKKANLFSAADELKIDVPEGFSVLQRTLDSLVLSHNQLSQKLSNEQTKAKNALRFHEIKMLLDDPMTSNDDTMQYLIITEIQRLYQRIKKEDYVFILTHNTHFYLNVRPVIKPTYKNGHEISFYEKYGTYHLISIGDFTSIKNVTMGKQDFNTSYDLLWKELVFIYSANDATPNLMLNSCRRICETYLKFTKLQYDKFYSDNKMAIKLFHVNSHSPDDYVAEQSRHTKDEIKNILSELFKANGAEEHFIIHWKGGVQYE